MFMKGQYYFQVIAVDGQCSGAPLSYKDLALKLGFGAFFQMMHVYGYKHASFERNRLLVDRFLAGDVATKNYMTGVGTNYNFPLT